MVSILVAALLGPQFAPSPARLRATVTHLSSFPTRNTNSPELTQAAAWVAEEFKKIPGLEVETMTYPIKKGSRVPADKDVVQVIATLPGETDHRVLVGGHLDSINLKEDPLTGIAPGADDDLSGVALTLECARLMAKRRWHNTLVFVAFTGEEQSLLGSAALAARAKKEGWKIDAFLNNDIVGASRRGDGRGDLKHIRVFSSAAPETNSRELARLAEFLNRKNDVKVQLVFRPDRFGRGGDHTSFNKQGFDAVRFTEVVENWDRQHNALDLPEYVNYTYLAGVTRANLNVLASLAQADPAPTDVKVTRNLSLSTELTWVSQPGVSYQIYWRRTTDAAWRGRYDVGAVNRYLLKFMSKDDLVFAVSSVGGVPVEAR